VIAMTIVDSLTDFAHDATSALEELGHQGLSVGRTAASRGADAASAAASSASHLAHEVAHRATRARRRRQRNRLVSIALIAALVLVIVVANRRRADHAETGDEFSSRENPGLRAA
jgi:hypothetical protein